MINIDKNHAHLKNDHLSYILEVDETGNLLNRHFGKPVRKYNNSGLPYYARKGFSTQHGSSPYSFDNYPFEYPVRSNGDFRIPAITIKQEDGIRDLDLRFKAWKILDEKPEIPGLPSVFSDKDESETLEVILEDQRAGIELSIYYTIFNELGIIAEHQRVKNVGEQTLIIENMKSASLELPNRDYEVLTLYGLHMKEANQSRHALPSGIFQIESTRGASSHHQNPFMAVITPDTNEDSGEVYAMNFVYSGNFQGQVQKDVFNNVRAQMGLHPDLFEWILEPGQEFYTPEVIINYSDEGLNGMAHNFHDLYTNHLIPQNFKERPLLFNSWEGTYFDVSLDKIKRQAEIAKDLGIELYVLDDGWFRNNSKSGMGDWVALEDKLPGGIDAAAEIVHDQGLKFGLWFEPEAVGSISKLRDAHPDWVMQLPGYELTEGRHELILDLSMPEVQDFIVDTLSSYLDKGNIEYIKWDFNRPITDYNSLKLDAKHKGEVGHRYILGLYNVFSRLREKYPEVLIEGCASGGGRFDPGMLYFVPQNWTSDNTDAYDRTIIQDGTALVYPPVTMGAHVSVTPNHQTGRNSSYKTRFDVARLFNFGYEVDITQLSDEELDILKKQIEEYKKDRDWVLNGTFYHHTTPDNYVMWSTVSEDKDKVLGVIFQEKFDLLSSMATFKFKGLDPEADYVNTATGEIYGGDELMEIGVRVPLEYEDYYTHDLLFEKVK